MFKNQDFFRGLFAILIVIGVVGGGIFWVMKGMSQSQQGVVAGDSDSKKLLEIEKQNLQNQIEKIKDDLQQIKPETITQQEQVQKILKDLDSVKQQASESVKILDWKGNLCEEAKKRFCE